MKTGIWDYLAAEDKEWAKRQSWGKRWVSTDSFVCVCVCVQTGFVGI